MTAPHVCHTRVPTAALGSVVSGPDSQDGLAICLRLHQNVRDGGPRFRVDRREGGAQLVEGPHW